MATPRQAIADFAVNNPYYAGATVTVYVTDAAFAKTGTLAPLYANPTGPAQLGNPQTLDSRGKWPQPVYVDRPVILTITRGVDVLDSGVVSPMPRWRGEWQSGVVYYAGDRVSIPASISVAVAIETHTSGVYATDLAAGRLEVEIPYEAHTHTASQISDATPAGRGLITAADDDAQLDALGFTDTGKDVARAASPEDARDAIGAFSADGGTITGNATITGALVPSSTFRRNRIINGSFGVNQRGVSGTVILAAGAYGHDMWKAGAAGCTYTFSASGADTIITITDGSLQQLIEDRNVEGGAYVLSHAGTAQARVAVNGGATTGSYAACPLTVGSSSGGQTVTVEFSTGTVSRVQLEPGGAPTPFERRFFGDEFLLCRRYFRQDSVFQGSNLGFFISYFGGTNAVSPQQEFSPPMRATPTVSFINPGIEYFSFGGAWTATTLVASPLNNSSYIIQCASDGDGRSKLMRNSGNNPALQPFVRWSAEP